MGNLILNLHSLAHKWAAWLARFRCCANYSTAIYYKFSFVLCCSNRHQTVVETGPFFSESVQECLCCCKTASKSQKGHVVITKTALCPTPSLCTGLAPLNIVSALAFSLWYEGSADSVHIAVCISGGVFLVLFSLDNRILTFLGSQETSWMHFREILSLIRRSSISSSLKACVVPWRVCLNTRGSSFFLHVLCPCWEIRKICWFVPKPKHWSIYRNVSIWVVPPPLVEITEQG